MRIESSTIADNIANAGGGVFADDAQSFAMSNSTVAGNDGQGGGLYFDSGVGSATVIANSTITGNDAADSDGGGIYFGGFGGSRNLILTSTIVAGNTADRGPDIHNTLPGNTSVLADHSVIGQTAPVNRFVESAPGTNKLGTGPIALGPLADNGGPTPTMLPALDGPAIDAGVANGLPTDQRGLARTVDQPLVPSGPGSDGTDIGAAELADAELSGAEASAKRKQKQKGRKIVVKVRVAAAEPAAATASGAAKLGKKKLPLKSSTVQLAAGASEQLKLKPKSKRATRKLVRALGRGKSAKATLRVVFTDAAGNTAEQSARAKLVD